MMKNVYSVGQVNTYIKNMFAQDFMMQRISVKGEVSNCKYHSSGHIYFTLKDPAGTINAIMFAGNRRGLSFQMKEGDKVIVTGSVEVYERDGKYQLYAREIELDGAGNLYLKFEALKKELEEMGMFAPEYKKRIPTYIRRLGIVTAPTGAAVQDIRNISARRNPYVQLILYPALVQGEGAKESIVNGIHALDAMHLDIIIVGRGGGSIEDLWAFNEEIVARAIFECETPVISAVGHELDYTIADYVADLRAPTPSAAAELAVYDRNQMLQRIRTDRVHLMRSMKSKIAVIQGRMETLKARLMQQSPVYRLNSQKQYLEELQLRLEHGMTQQLDKNKARLRMLAQHFDDISPLKRLGQGYAYVSDSRQNGLKSVSQVSKGEQLQISVKDGTVKARVEEIICQEEIGR
mgnify:FL=1